METPEEFVGSNDHQIQSQLVSDKPRRRRYKRNLTLLSSSSTSSSSCGGATASSSVSGDTNHNPDHDHHEIIISTEEEEDMANCLILLAQGDHSGHHPPPTTSHQILQSPLKRFNFDHKTTAGFYVYECKTCNRTFPSFQALGGHRASHKKPKPIPTVAAVEEPDHQESQLIKIATPTIQIPTKPTTMGNTGMNFQAHKGGKVHECSICGLEFTSGQALGGHMRRHRASTATVSSAQQVVMATNNTEHNNHNHQIRKERNILELDLNLPAPEEDLRETKFPFTATPQTIVFSAPTLVDCHY